MNSAPSAVSSSLQLRVPVVHAVTSDEIVARRDFIDVACGVMGVMGARGALHLRAPRLGAVRLYELAEALAAAQSITGAWLVVNDRVDVDLAVRGPRQLLDRPDRDRRGGDPRRLRDRAP